MTYSGGQGLVPGLVSIVIPVHNGMPHIRQALQSALDQDYGDLEVLIMENQSDDGTEAWLNEIDDPRLRVEKQPELVPVDRNFSDAVSRAYGEFIRILCADDFLKPGAVSAHVDAFSRHPTSALVASPRDICDERGKTLIKGRGLDGLDEVNTRLDVVGACAEYGTNVIGEPFCRTAALQTELPFNPDLRFVLDIELYVRALSHGDLVTIPGSFSVFRVGASSYSANASNTQATQFAEWLDQLQADPTLELTDESIEHARKQARKNQFARNLLYRYLGIRDRMHRFKWRNPL